MQGADIIVFPEYGIFPDRNRSVTRKCLESIPNPKESTATPCDEAEAFAARPILYTLSCMAKAHSMVIVANMGGIEYCENPDECPPDGYLQHNANVAFEKNGTLIARYYKEHLFYEANMDLPRKKQDPVFSTSVGKFATFICFDLIFEKIAMVARRADIDAILFSTMWGNQSPFHTSTQHFQAWAIGNNATLLSANIQKPGYLGAGSGIFMGEKGSIGHTLTPDGVSKLVVAQIPRNNRVTSPTFNITAVFENGTTQPWTDDSAKIPDVCSWTTLGLPKNPNKDYRCTTEKTSNYTLAKLIRTNDHLEVCNNGMCCELDYVARSMNESYYLGVYNGSHSPFTRYYFWEENCFLARCDDVNGIACSTFPMTSHTVFHRIRIRANFTSKRVYPSFVGDRLKLVPVKDWKFDTKPDVSSIELRSNAGIPLLAATLNGRPYEKDPPYRK